MILSVPEIIPIQDDFKIFAAFDPVTVASHVGNGTGGGGFKVTLASIMVIWRSVFKPKSPK